MNPESRPFFVIDAVQLIASDLRESYRLAMQSTGVSEEQVNEVLKTIDAALPISLAPPFLVSNLAGRGCWHTLRLRT